MDSVGRELLGKLPQIDVVLRQPEIAASTVPRWALVEGARFVVAQLRARILAGECTEAAVSSAEVLEHAEALLVSPLHPVINATGVVVHTNLGRAPLASSAIEMAGRMSAGYCSLEYDLAEGKRGSRHRVVADLLLRLTGAEAAAVTNNNAAAMLLALAACAGGRCAVVSRGELIEIGGSFRIPDIMAISTARLREVGTTNRTRLADYDAAIDDETALLVKVHRSNFEIVGFAEDTPVSEIADLAHARGIRCLVDLGSGSLLSREAMDELGFTREPTVAETVAAGADVVCFSGDKLLGGPQCGILVGKRDAIALITSHSLMRALRPGKLTLAALLATLQLYRDGQEHQVPTIQLLRMSVSELRTRALALQARLASQDLVVDVVEVDSAVGGGALPVAQLPSVALSLRHRALSAQRLARALRSATPAIVTRIVEDRVIFDLRTVHVDAFDTVVTLVLGVAREWE